MNNHGVRTRPSGKPSIIWPGSNQKYGWALEYLVFELARDPHSALGGRLSINDEEIGSSLLIQEHAKCFAGGKFLNLVLWKVRCHSCAQGSNKSLANAGIVRINHDGRAKIGHVGKCNQRRPIPSPRHKPTRPELS